MLHAVQQITLVLTQAHLHSFLVQSFARRIQLDATAGQLFRNVFGDFGAALQNVVESSFVRQNEVCRYSTFRSS